MGTARVSAPAAGHFSLLETSRRQRALKHVTVKRLVYRQQDMRESTQECFFAFRIFTRRVCSKKLAEASNIAIHVTVSGSSCFGNVVPEGDCRVESERF